LTYTFCNIYNHKNYMTIKLMYVKIILKTFREYVKNGVPNQKGQKIPTVENTYMFMLKKK
jgi:hypothetical protein